MQRIYKKFKKTKQQNSYVNLNYSDILVNSFKLYDTWGERENKKLYIYSWLHQYIYYVVCTYINSSKYVHITTSISFVVLNDISILFTTPV
jgi:hypothetical protein